MAKRFRLQKVLEIREMTEKEKQKEHALTKRKLQMTEMELNRLTTRVNDFAEEMNGAARAQAQRLVEHHGYLTTLADAALDLEKEIASIEAEVEKKRRALLEAAKNRKALQKLKEKKELAWMLAEDKEEQAFLDEIAMRKKKVSE
ncbi:MAG: flagellar export protein FliJ [Calditrichaeota bacterium]|nr:flagellar export protein FliJ [Calditrichota bacterium]